MKDLAPTPETDAFGEGGKAHYMALDFARNLERERDEAREQLEAMREALKAVDAALRAWPKAGSGMSTDHTLQSQAFRTGQAAIKKLKPFITP